MPSTPPPLPFSHPRLTPWQVPPPRKIGEPSRIHWSVILASAFLSFALVGGVFAWIFTHPHKAAWPSQAARVAAVEPPAAPPTPIRAFSATPAFHHSPPREAISNKIPLMEEDPPSLPPPKQHSGYGAEWMPPWQQPPPPKKPTGETYGTQILFLNNREAAAVFAQREHKLLFVMHISGNFEESCFT